MASTELPPDQLRLVDQLCSAFEQAWINGSPLSVGPLLEQAPEVARPVLLRDLLRVEFEYNRKRDDAARFQEVQKQLAALGEWALPVLQEPGLQAGGAGPGQSLSWVSQARAAGAPAQPARLGLGPFEQVELLGQGGMGAVYKAFDTSLKRWVALKCVRPDKVSPEALQRFYREGQAVARVSHPHIVQVFGWSEYQGQPTLVMEFVPGGTLSGALRQRRLAPAESAQVMAVVAWAVQHAHEAGICHRDLKPANVLLAARVAGSKSNTVVGCPKVGDFGLARLVSEDGLTSEGVIVGTVAYMSPEQAEGKPADVGPAADVWSLGVMLYEMLGGRLPFVASSTLGTLRQIVQDAHPPLASLAPAVPAELSSLCDACLSKDPGKRPSAGQLAECLEEFLREGLGETREQPALLRGQPSRWQKPDDVPTGSQVLREMGISVMASTPNPETTRVDDTRTPARPSRWWMVATAAALLSAAGLASWWLGPWGKPAGSSGPPAFKGSVDILVYRVDPDGSDGLYPLSDPRAMPLRPGDQFKITAEVQPPAYLYLFWIDETGATVPLYPWTLGKWGTRPAREERVDRKEIKSPSGKALTVTGATAGMETMLMLACAAPLDAREAEIRGWFVDLKALRFQGEKARAWFENFDVLQNDPTRALMFIDGGRFGDTPLGLQETLAGRIGKNATYSRAITFGRLGKKEEP